MRVIVIHNKNREDRLENINNLRKFFPNLEIVDACVPEWEKRNDSRCMRGCTVSHLIAAGNVLRGAEEVLVLEDDAVLVGEPPDFSKVPQSAGIVIYGADIEKVADSFNGFRQFFIPFWGTQAVLYRPHPNFGTFLVQALTASSALPFGFNDGEFSPESIIYNAAAAAKMLICRPDKMSFTTLGDISESVGFAQPPRIKSFEIIEKQSLLPIETWDCIFDKWRGKKASLIIVPGNAGDVLINAATRQLFQHYNITEVTSAEADVVFHCGGGNVSGRYDFSQYAKEFIESSSYKVILPQSIETTTSKILEAADEVWLRENYSLALYPNAKFAPDLALAYRTALNPEHGDAIDIAFRIDNEKSESVMIGRDPATICHHHYAYLNEAAKAKEIHTNRLHYAICGLILGKDVTLYPNDYHKTRGVWEANLAALGCKWKDTYL